MVIFSDRKRLGPFNIRRRDPFGRWEQFPPALWKAINDPVAWSSGAAGAGASTVDDGSEEAAVEIDAEDVQLLLANLKKKVCCVVGVGCLRKRPHCLGSKSLKNYN